ncbi:YitT family protein [Bacillus sp. 03113]|uniref:YitT family protein n=1 Tax=Bacillus sp. 03113 TaxID=2578211 RepID=UPI001144DC63|nr:YitT family protein [Bacillus sp. 03113]
MKTWWINILFIMLGSAIMGWGINCFNIANGLSEGGIMGIALILKYLFGWDPGLSSIIINLPLLWIGWRIMGRESFIFTIIGTVCLSVFLSVFQQYSLVMEDKLLASIYAGAAVGIGLGIVFRFGGMTDGVDIIARLFQKYFGWSMGSTILLLDAIVLLLSLVYLDLERAMYTILAVFVGAKLIDYIQEGSYAAKAVTIMSTMPDQISEQILAELNRGVTFLNGKGGYTRQDKEIIYCVISRSETVKLRNIVHEIDPSAFVIFNKVHEVFGKGWKEVNN